MKTMTAHQALEIVRTSKLNPKPDPISLNSVNSIGEWVRQGDIYITAVERPMKNCKPIDNFDGQLAVGNSRGSRHCISRNQLSSVKAYHHPDFGSRTSPEAGMFLEIAKDVEVTHPEHGTVNLGPGCYEVTYQVDFFGKEKSRVRD